MDPQTIDQAHLAAPPGMAAHDFSIWGLFLEADPVVKVTMAILLLASVWCWAIIFDKTVRLRFLKSRADRFEDTFWSGGSLDTLYERAAKKVRDPMAATFVAGMREWKLASERGIGPDLPMRVNLQQRIDRVMAVTIGREMAQVERYMNVLATVGSTAPFLGLFGTVWGIMNSFTSIAQQQNTNLAVVAPGIAEALSATALGLIAAIPAVVAYNKFSTDLGRYAERLDAFSSEFSAILSRHLEEKG
jgi:biopolymer transport protein TolQ